MFKKIDFSKLKSLIWIIIILIPIAFFFFKTETKQKLPEWYENIPKNTELYFYGIGDGYNLEIATQSAIKNLISRLMESGNSDSIIWRKKDYKNSTEFHDKINETLRMVIIPDYEIVQSRYLNEKVYVILAIKKVEFIEKNIDKLTEINSEIKVLDDETIEKHILLRRKTLMKINKLGTRAEKITKVLKNITSDINSKNNLKIYKDFRKEYDKLNKKIEFYVKGKDVTKNIIKAFENGIYDINLTVANKLNESDRNLVVINIKTKTSTKTVFKTIHAKINIDISVESGKGKKLIKTKLEINGNSTINKKEAIDNAATNLTKIIKQEGIIRLIGGEN